MARVKTSGGQIVVRPANVLLQVFGATIADVTDAASSIEPTAPLPRCLPTRARQP